MFDVVIRNDILFFSNILLCFCFMINKNRQKLEGMYKSLFGEGKLV